MERTFTFPEGVSATLAAGGTLTVKGPKGELSRRFAHPKVALSLEGGMARIAIQQRTRAKDETVRRKLQALAGTWEAHIRNMSNGVRAGWEARVKVVFSHFPIKVTTEGDSVLISNFLGERSPRRSRILPGTKVSIQKDEIIVTGIDREAVGQTAANIETASKITRYDRRVFQDGCHLTQHPQPASAQPSGPPKK